MNPSSDGCALVPTQRCTRIGKSSTNLRLVQSHSTQFSASSNLTPPKSPLFSLQQITSTLFLPQKNEKSIQSTIMKNAPNIVEDTYIGSYSLETAAFFCVHAFFTNTKVRDHCSIKMTKDYGKGHRSRQKKKDKSCYYFLINWVSVLLLCHLFVNDNKMYIIRYFCNFSFLFKSIFSIRTGG